MKVWPQISADSKDFRGWSLPGVASGGSVSLELKKRGTKKTRYQMGQPVGSPGKDRVKVKKKSSWHLAFGES